MNIRSKLDRRDLIILILITALAILYPLLLIGFKWYPHEDAAILMRYAKHLGEGHGIVYNIGEKPVDGATDFLFMVLIALIYMCGVPLEITVFLIVYISHVLNVIIIYIAIRTLYVGKKWMASLSSTYLAIGPAIGCIAGLFGATFFALFVCITWCYSYKLIEEYDSKKYNIRFAFFGLITALIRPEGVFLVILFLISIIWLNGFKKSKKSILYTFIIFGSIGGIYLIWRWLYFGYPLPNPYYKKGGFTLHFDGLIDSGINGLFMFLPFLIVFFIGFIAAILHFFGIGTKVIFKQFIYCLIPIIGFLSIWILLSSWMNIFGRFQYPILPIFLMLWPLLLKTISEDWKRVNFPKYDFLIFKDEMIKAILLLCCFIGVMFYQYWNYNTRIKTDLYNEGVYDVAIMLNDYKDKDYTLLTTEAGILPLYSEWESIDAWGLNDQWIAHNVEITDDFIDKYDPELIMYHQWAINDTDSEKGDWHSMLKILQDYAQENNYYLAASYGIIEDDTHVYYVSRNFTDSIEIIEKIQDIEYLWYNGIKCENYIPEAYIL